MTNADEVDRKTLQQVLDSLWKRKTTSCMWHDAERGYKDIPALLSALRSALQVPDAAEHDCEDVGFERGWRLGLHQGQAEAVAQVNARVVYDPCPSPEYLEAYAAPVRAQARREAIEECIEALWEIGAGRPERHTDNFVTGAIEMRRAAEARIRAIAAQPAARGIPCANLPDWDEIEREKVVGGSRAVSPAQDAQADGPGSPSSPPPDDVAAFSGWKPNAQELARMREAMRPTQPPAPEHKPYKRCGKYVGDNDATCPQLACIRRRGHMGLCDNVIGDPDPVGSAPPAPEPEPDVWEAVSKAWISDDSEWDNKGRLADICRTFFGPLVEALERVAWRNADAPGSSEIAKATLAQLRARAKEADRG